MSNNNAIFFFACFHFEHVAPMEFPAKELILIPHFFAGYSLMRLYQVFSIFQKQP
jgi:hypothetical protein